jgi:hypothetical protein
MEHRLIVNVNVQKENRIFFSLHHLLFFCSYKLNRARYSKYKTHVYMYVFHIMQFPMRKKASGYKSIEELSDRVNVKTTFMHF